MGEKSKWAASLAASIFLVAPASWAGPQFGVFINTGQACAPGPLLCPPRPACAPSFFPGYFTPGYTFVGPLTFSYSTGSVTSTSQGAFTTVSSPFFNGGAQPVIRVPPPVVIDQPVIVYPNTGFGWRR